MTTVFHTWLYGRFIEIQSNLRKKKLQRMNQGCNFQKLQLFTKYLGQTLDFMCNSALQEKFNFSSLEDFF